MTHFGVFPMALPILLALPLASPALAADLSTKVEEAVFADTALDQCVKSYAKREGYETVGAVKEIPCFNMGIKSIQGLEIFTEALVVDLSRNQIQDFTPLYTHTTQLGYIDIHGNPIKCSDMLKLSHQLKNAWRVGFDTNNCIMDGDESQPKPANPAPTPPELPTKPAPSSPTPPRAPAGEVTFAAIAPILAAACGSCHQGGKHKGGVVLDDEASLHKYSRSSREEIARGSMPPKEPGWRDSSDGQLLLKYLEQEIAAGRAPAGKGGHDHDDDEHDDDDDEHDDD